MPVYLGSARSNVRKGSSLCRVNVVGPTPSFTVTITGQGDVSYCYLSIDGVKYYSAATIDVESGTVISCTAEYKECDCGKEGGGGVMLNTNWVGVKNYTYTVTKNLQISLGYESDECKCEDVYRYASVKITEE